MTRKKYTQADFVRGRDEAVGGIVCHGCGCRHFLVVYTRRERGRIVRRRECRHCGRRITTYEQEKSDGTSD